MPGGVVGEVAALAGPKEISSQDAVRVFPSYLDAVEARLVHRSVVATMTAVRRTSTMAPMAVPCTAAAIVLLAGLLYAAPDLPELTGPVNDFAHVIDGSSAAEIDRMSRALQQKTGDAIVVATSKPSSPTGTSTNTR